MGLLGKPTILGNHHLLLESSAKMTRNNPQNTDLLRTEEILTNGRELGIFPRFN